MSTSTPKGPTPDQVTKLYGQWTEEEGYPEFLESDYDHFFSAASRLGTPGARVLDLGCGMGVVAGRLKTRGHHVTGVDLSSEAIALAKLKGRIDEGVVGNVLKTGLPAGSFDVTVYFGVLLHVPELRQTFEEARRVLKPGGQILIVDHHAANPYVWLHFHRPNWVDRALEGRSNIPRRALDPRMIREATPSGVFWDEPRFVSAYTRHQHPIINGVHDVARAGFSVIRRVIQAPWTGNMLVQAGRVEAKLS